MRLLSRLRSHLPLSSRLRWRVVAGLAAVGLVAVAGVAVVGHVLAASAERDTARQAARAEALVIREAMTRRDPDQLAEVLAPATGVDGLVVDRGGAVVATTDGLSSDDLPSPLPADGAILPATIDGVPVLVTATGLPDGTRLVLAVDQTQTEASLAGLRRSMVAAAVVVALGLVVVTALVTHRVLEPVDRTARAARQLAQGALGTRLGGEGPQVFADLTGAFDEMAAALEATVTGLRRLEERQRRFVADVSHELRTPLQALSTASDLVEPGIPRLTGAERRGAEALVAEVRRLRVLVEDLMEISRLDAEESGPMLERVELRRTVERMLAHRGWQDRVVVEVPWDLGLTTDRRRLDTILANLVGNALTHGAEPVVLRATSMQDRVALEVADAGPGIPGPDRERVFDRFAKADAARTRGGGSGLGLAIAREHARSLGADLTLSCPDEGGTVVRLEHPVAGSGPTR